MIWIFKHMEAFMSDKIRAQLINFLGHMPVAGLCELVKELEDRWDVTASSGAHPGFCVDDTNCFKSLERAEQTEFDVVMTSFGHRKIGVIKIVRDLTGLGLKEAKELVESAPAKIKEGVDRATADGIIAQLEAVGAQASMR
jgi:large subunit ribosomal protein L7/L12